MIRGWFSFAPRFADSHDPPHVTLDSWPPRPAWHSSRRLGEGYAPRVNGRRHRTQLPPPAWCVPRNDSQTSRSGDTREGPCSPPREERACAPTRVPDARHLAIDRNVLPAWRTRRGPRETRVTSTSDRRRAIQTPSRLPQTLTTLAHSHHRRDSRA